MRIVDSKATNVVADPVSSDSTFIEIGIPGGFTLRAVTETDTEWVGKWIAAIIKLAAS
jgi:hypothetical protein